MRTAWSQLGSAAFVAVLAVGCPETPTLELPPPAERIGELHQLLLPDVADPAETLAVRVVGTVGPDGSWASGGTSVLSAAHEIVIAPRVRRVPGDFFLQALVPYDTIVHLALPVAGTWTVRAAARDTVLERQVNVRAGARRSPPSVRAAALASSAAGDEQFVPVEAVAAAASGFIARVEWRDGDAGEWTPVHPAEPAGTAATGRFAVRRPPMDGPRRIEVRAVDGQGVVSAPAVVELPAR